MGKMQGLTAHASVAVMAAFVFTFPTPDDVWISMGINPAESAPLRYEAGGVDRTVSAAPAFREVVASLQSCTTQLISGGNVEAMGCPRAIEVAEVTVASLNTSGDLTDRRAAIATEELKLTQVAFCRHQWEVARVAGRSFNPDTCRPTPVELAMFKTLD